MANARRNCPRCGDALSSKRNAARKKYCFRCEVAVRRQQSDAKHDGRVGRLYGLRPGEYKQLFEAQEGRCAIKRCKARGVSLRLAVDHDHRIGPTREAVRGLLCKRHNNMIGEAGDDPEVFDCLATYLRHPPAREVLK